MMLMADVQTTTTALVRVAGRRMANSRVLRAAAAAGTATARSLGHVAHLLWLQITGVFFLFFALVGGLAVRREYFAYTSGKVGPGRAVLAGCFMLLMLWFGVSSFWRVRKKS
jgi:hypothetical protein